MAARHGDPASAKFLIDHPEVLEAELKAFWLSGEHELFGQRARSFCDVIYGGVAPRCDDNQNPYWSIVLQLPYDGLIGRGSVMGWAAIAGFPQIYREHLVCTYAWAIPSPADLDVIVEHLQGRPVLEMAAGTGYWAWQLSQRGVDVLAFDDFSWRDTGHGAAVQYHPVQAGSVEQIPLHPNRVLLLCWPPYDTSLADEALRCYEGDTVIYVGEGWGGCTGDDAFGAQLAKEWTSVDASGGHVNFSGIRSELIIYQRRDVPLTDEEVDSSW